MNSEEMLNLSHWRTLADQELNYVKAIYTAMHPQRFPLIYHDTVSAGSEKTLVSGKIPFAFIIREVQVGFAPGVNRTLQIKVIVSADANAPSSGEPAGSNLFAPYNETPYLIGDDALLIIPITYPVAAGKYVKVYANNTDGFDHTIDVRVMCERIG